MSKTHQSNRLKTASKVLVLVRLKYSSGRKFLSGMLGYMSEGHAYNLKLLQEPDELTAETILNAKQDGVDGIILSIPGTQEGMKALAQSDIPTVFVNIYDKSVAKRSNSSFIWTDNADIARKGISHLISCGDFMSFAYVHASPESADWSDERARAFCRGVKARGFSPTEYPPRDDIGSDDDIKSLARFIDSLSKPAAVMASFDWRATHVLDACKSVGLEVPRQVAVLGVDNDEFCCPLSNPPLSSVQPDFSAIGERAVAELATMLRRCRSGQQTRQTHIRIASSKVVVRESTAPIPPVTSLMRKIIAIVKDHAHEGITPSEVARRLNISRRLADMRMSEVRGETLKTMIENERLSRVRQLLKTTSRPISLIAAEAGFKNATHLSHLFRKNFGMTMREFRTSCGHASAAKKMQIPIDKPRAEKHPRKTPDADVGPVGYRRKAPKPRLRKQNQSNPHDAADDRREN